MQKEKRSNFVDYNLTADCELPLSKKLTAAEIFIEGGEKSGYILKDKEISQKFILIIYFKQT